MPHIRIEHSANLAGAFDGPALALDIHRLCVEKVGATIGACKSRILNMGDIITADGTAEGAMLHVEMGLLSGRSVEARSALSDAVIARVAEALSDRAGVAISVEIRNMDAETYRKQVTS